MYKRIDFTQLEGFPLTQDTLAHLQKSYRDAFAGISHLFGDYVILSGVVDVGGGVYSAGWIAYNGEILPFETGSLDAQIVIEETSEGKMFADAVTRNVWFTRVAKFGAAGGVNFGTFVRLSTIKQIVADVASTTSNANGKVNKAGDTMTGALAMSGQKITGVGNGTDAADAVNKGQLDTAISNLVNGAGAALDTLLELAEALGNDPNFAATVAASINAANANANSRVAKAGDTMTGNLILSGAAVGINTDNVVLKTKVIEIGDWNMQAATTKSVAHGLPNHLKIRSVTGQIRADDGTVHPFGVCVTETNTMPSCAVIGTHATTIDLIRLLTANGGYFENANFNQWPDYNRGWLIIIYEA